MTEDKTNRDLIEAARAWMREPTSPNGRVLTRRESELVDAVVLYNRERGRATTPVPPRTLDEERVREIARAEIGLYTFDEDGIREFARDEANKFMVEWCRPHNVRHEEITRRLTALEASDDAGSKAMHEIEGRTVRLEGLGPATVKIINDLRDELLRALESRSSEHAPIRYYKNPASKTATPGESFDGTGIVYSVDPRDGQPWTEARAESWERGDAAPPAPSSSAAPGTTPTERAWNAYQSPGPIVSNIAAEISAAESAAFARGRAERGEPGEAAELRAACAKWLRNEWDNGHKDYRTHWDKDLEDAIRSDAAAGSGKGGPDAR